MTFNWGEFKDEIKRLYMKEGKSLDEVRDILRTTQFNPSIRAYKKQLDEWGFRKYKRRRHGDAVTTVDLSQEFTDVVITEAASSLLQEWSTENVQRSLKQVETELNSQAAAVREQHTILYKLSRKRRRQDYESDSEEFCKSKERITQLETSITQMRKTLEKVMTTVAVQTSRPTGFASCWKQEPMTLEDAHGKLLPLPLELVVSWEVLDSILLGHFRAVVGEKKVQKREFEIEDGETGVKLARTIPLPQVFKPGRKLEMSMSFRAARKTIVVCPKCNTISKEQEGVRVTCPNPECQMIFRAEDDDGIDENLLGERRPLSRLSGRKRIPSTFQEVASPVEPEDRPGMFKRVIIRLVRSYAGQTSHRNPDSQSARNTTTELRSFATLTEQPVISFTPEFMSTLPGWSSPLEKVNFPALDDGEFEQFEIVSNQEQFGGRAFLTTGIDAFCPLERYRDTSSVQLSNVCPGCTLENDGFPRFLANPCKLCGAFVSWNPAREDGQETFTSAFGRNSASRPKSISPPPPRSEASSDSIHLDLEGDMEDIESDDNIEASDEEEDEDGGFEDYEQFKRSQEHQRYEIGGEPQNKNSERFEREMSSGGVSVGSWIRDDIKQPGTLLLQSSLQTSPSFESSSYLPKLEANFMRDFYCCGQILSTLHDLLQHYEECHEQQTPSSLRAAGAAARAVQDSSENAKCGSIYDKKLFFK